MMEDVFDFLREALPWIVMSLLLAVLLARGSRVKNTDAYLLDIQRMNGTDLHTLELQKGLFIFSREAEK